jgi:two-component system CheB/CheR fusion protein
MIEGAVILFVDISDLKVARDALQKSNDMLRLATIVKDSNDAITLCDLQGRIVAWNPSATRLYGWSEPEALNKNIDDLIPEEHKKKTIEIVKKLSMATILEPYRMQIITKDGTVVEVIMTSSALVDAAGRMYAIATIERLATL